jgi:hypothetical protein
VDGARLESHFDVVVCALFSKNSLEGTYSEYPKINSDYFPRVGPIEEVSISFAVVRTTEPAQKYFLQPP